MKTIVFLLLLLANLGIIVAVIINLLRLSIKFTRKKDTLHLRKVLGKNGIVLLGAVILMVGFIVFTHFTSYTPKVTDADGNKIEGSISELVQVEVNGHKEWLSIRGTTEDNPILLFLAGGPGGTQMAATRYELSALEKEFVVVNWDQPGSGKSYNCMKRSDITIDTYIEDGRAVTKYLCDRFGKEKIYLVGESWGSALGILLAKRYPESYYGLIGTGQMVDFEETEKIDYEKAIQILKDSGNTKKVDALKKQGAPLYYDGNIALKSNEYLGVLTDEMTRNPKITNGGYQTLRDMFAEEYDIMDSIHFMLGVMNTFNVVYPQLYDVDLRKGYTDIKIPVYFFIGRHDINAPTTLAEDYYNRLHCPKKELVWFEHSGHSAWINENELFAREVVRVFKK